jgi:thiamine biosynthesis lipoprotein
MRRVELVMGTSISLVLADTMAESSLDRLADETFAWLHAVDARFSTYRDDSEVCRPVTPPSADLAHVRARCAELWHETAGYFDADATGRFDPSGFVKGWAVQVASDRLVAAGSRNHLLNAGGDVRVRGEAAPDRPWRVGVRHPWRPDEVCCVVAGTDLAVATSGVYERGHHVIDPFSGAPARGLRSVTVVASGPGADLGTADALATAALAMGRAGIEWLAKLDGYECAVITDDAEFVTSPTLPTAD